MDSHCHLIALFKYLRHEKSSEDYLIRPSLTDCDCRPCFSEMMPSMLTKEPGWQMRSRLTEKLTIRDTFSIIICGGKETKKVNCSRIFSTRDLQEQARKSYVTSYQVNGELGDPANVFSWTTSMKVIHAGCLPRTIPNI